MKIKNKALVTVFGIFWEDTDNWITPEIENKYKIFTRQAIELLFIFFYIILFFEFVVKIWMNKGNMSITVKKLSFVKEAESNANNLDYLKHRKWYAMWRK